MDQVFIDGVGAVAVVGGTVRLDLITYSPTEKDANGQALGQVSQRVIMTLDGFLRLSEKLEETARALAKLTAQQNQRMVQPVPQTMAPAPMPEPIAAPQPVAAAQVPAEVVQPRRPFP